MQTETKSIAISKLLVWQQVAVFALFHAFAVVALFYFSWSAVAASAVSYFLTGCLGISLGYHRLLAHKAYDAPKPIKYAFATLGALSLQGGPLRWSAAHRAHHRHANRSGDPHSRTKGWAWSHFVWIFFKAPNGYRYRHLNAQVPDLAADRYLSWLERHHITLNLVLLLAFAVLTNIETVLWVFFVRTVLVWHATWLINSICHRILDNAAPDDIDASKNSVAISFLTFGEGLHENHHQHPRNAIFGTIAQGDIGGIILRGLARINVVGMRNTI